MAQREIVLPSGKPLKMANQEPKKNGNGKVQMNIRTNNSEQFEGTTHQMWGFEARRARKFTRTLPRASPWNFIAILSAPPGQNVHGFHVGPPICHVVPVSHAYPLPGFEFIQAPLLISEEIGA